MRILLVFVALLLMLGTGTTRAAELRGQDDDPRFQDALALWLADDEETALPELAALAAAGNRAAQVLLALIDATPRTQGPWLVGLSRAERIGLLRAPGGPAGRSWMQAAAVDTPFAQLWLVLSTPEATPETAPAFAAIGEHRAARHILFTLATRSYRGFAAIANYPNYPPDMRFLIWREWAGDPATRALAEAEIAAVHPGDPQVSAHLDFHPIEPSALENWLAGASLAAPLRAVCEVACPVSVRSCTRAAYELGSGFGAWRQSHDGLLLLGSPSETLVAPDLWNASPRGRASVLRQFANTRYAKDVAAAVPAEDACLAEALTEEAARFSN